MLKEISITSVERAFILTQYAYKLRNFIFNISLNDPVFEISAGPLTLTGKIWVSPASFPSLSYINFGKIVLRSGKFQILL